MNWFSGPGKRNLLVLPEIHGVMRKCGGKVFNEQVGRKGMTSKKGTHRKAYSWKDRGSPRRQRMFSVFRTPTTHYDALGNFK